jgi:hypothetical protein
MTDEPHKTPKECPPANEAIEGTFTRRNFLKVFGIGAAAILALGAKDARAADTEIPKASTGPRPADDEAAENADTADHQAELKTADGDNESDDPRDSFAQYWRRRRRRYVRRVYRRRRRYLRRYYRVRRRYVRRVYRRRRRYLRRY